MQHTVGELFIRIISDVQRAKSSKLYVYRFVYGSSSINPLPNFSGICSVISHECAILEWSVCDMPDSSQTRLIPNTTPFTFQMNWHQAKSFVNHIRISLFVGRKCTYAQKNLNNNVNNNDNSAWLVSTYSYTWNQEGLLSCKSISIRMYEPLRSYEFNDLIII